MGGVIILVFAVFFICLGPFLVRVGWNSRGHARRLAILPRFDPNYLEMGQQGYVEGILTASNVEKEFGLVAYRRYRYGGERTRRHSDPTSVSGSSIQREPIWTEEEGDRPVLLLESSGEPVRVAGPYHLTHVTGRFVSDETLKKGQSYKLEGVAVGDAVVAVGEIAIDDKGKLIYATDVAGTDFQSFRDNYRSSGTAAVIGGAIMTFLGLILAATGIALVA